MTRVYSSAAESYQAFGSRSDLANSAFTPSTTNGCGIGSGAITASGGSSRTSGTNWRGGRSAGDGQTNAIRFTTAGWVSAASIATRPPIELPTIAAGVAPIES